MFLSQLCFHGLLLAFWVVRLGGIAFDESSSKSATTGPSILLFLSSGLLAFGALNIKLLTTVAAVLRIVGGPDPKGD